MSVCLSVCSGPAVDLLIQHRRFLPTALAPNMLCMFLVYYYSGVANLASKIKFTIPFFFFTDFLTFEFNKPSTVDQTLRFSPELPFIKPVEVFQVSSRGGQYCDDSLGLCIDVPEGAVPEGRLLQLEIGMCLYGPFKFPGNLYPIAPILMLCPQSNIKLSRRLRITLPHIISDADEGEIDFFDVQVIKADHTSLFTANETIFDNIIGESNLSLHTSNNCEVATFELSNFCFVTLRATANLQELAERKGYCICPLLPSPDAMSSVSFMYHLCVTYFIKPCLEVSILQHGMII